MLIRPHLRRLLSLSFVVCSTSAWLTACASKPITADAPPPSVLPQHAAAADTAQALDPEWAGTYQAVLPCHHCPGTAIRVQLRPDMTATVRERRLGTPTEEGAAQTYQGPFRWSQRAQESLITLGQPQDRVPAYQFAISASGLELRERTTGAPLSPSAMYRLRKTSLAP